MCWSFGTSKREQFAKSNIPGPGTYEYKLYQTLSNKKSSPHWKIGSSLRYSNSKMQNPGPGTYNYKVHSNSKIRTSAKYSFGLKLESFIEKKDKVPGAGQYDPKIVNQLELNAPKYSFGLKTNPNFNKISFPGQFLLSQIHYQIYKKQGPGSYEYKSVVENIPSYKIGRSKREGLANSNNYPGPNTYQQKRPFSSEGPKYGFGTSQRQFYERIHSPGPGTYNYSKNLLNQSLGKSFGLRLQDSIVNLKNKTPGPGSYQANKLKGKQQIIFGRSQRQFYGGAKYPGPGTYHPEFVQLDKPKTPTYKIGTDKRRPLSASTTKTPGPGNYRIPDKIVEGPKYIFGLKTPNLLGFKQQPGPGAYSPLTNLILERSQASLFGTSNRESQLNLKNPGPGTYQIKKQIQGPKYGFGSSIRPKIGKNEGPGPGQYNIPPMFGKVPSYLINNSPSKFVMTSHI